MNPKLTLLILSALGVCFATKRLRIRASVYLLAYFTALNVFAANKYVTSGTEAESDQTYESIANRAALQVSGSETWYSGTNLTLSATFNSDAGSYGAYVYNQGRVELHGGTVTVTGTSGHGLLATGTSALTADGVSIRVAQDRGVTVIERSTANLQDTVIKVGLDNQAIRSSFGVFVDGTGSGLNGARLTVDAYGYGLASGIPTAGMKAGNGGLIDLTDSTISVHGVTPDDSLGGSALYVQQSGAIRGAGLTAVATGHVVRATEGGRVVLIDSDLTGMRGGINVTDGSAIVYAPAEVIIIGGTLAVTEGNVMDIGLVYNPADTPWNPDAGSRGRIILNDTVVIGADGNLISNFALNGEVEITLNNVETANTGGITLSGSNSGATTVNVNGGSGITGDLINSGSGTLTVNLNDSALTGDIANLGDGALVIILDHESTGSGGFRGGDLITGGDSTWTFDQDSHGNYGENHGTWNIGDYDVTFDNLDHTGTVNISVNSDTGAGGSIIVTDTAAGEGKIHITTTGDGQADPNKVLPDIVSGDGTEHWQWDPIDWGIDQLIKDGDRFVKNGTSPAGAVLNSAIAVQQAMWFAQQNSLLKRMGELRYGARASRPLAGETPAFHNLIENIWLRSYGQQLNVGSQVAGKAYEQLIYGVDLGTDHKFTISADSDLYLGVYAGYGRSDLDYRTPGADGEINSYYGGLYATWLHSSGFYIDATFKVASVNNDLKAPYGNTQLKASYSDVNIGGSIEIGNKFTFTDDWFIEPQFQVNYLHILAENYTAGHMNLKAQDLDALQLRIGSLLGRTINLTNSGALKISGVETISSGGTLRNGYQHTRANTDGARAELGAGLIWQLDANNQLHLDYEASFGDKYDKPWGLTAGYRHQF
ncbi:MAG: autotransporter outer membrane beta-barrel domain-containing protein [Verrucomicrobiales bacterium]|jgi:outer membrane autotransporter protein|nr:autotransporter outer membrane beta-barrel domain-containing protein [Verrucomicrobiales bacterium]